MAAKNRTEKAKKSRNIYVTFLMAQTRIVSLVSHWIDSDRTSTSVRRIKYGIVDRATLNYRFLFK